MHIDSSTQREIDRRISEARRRPERASQDYSRACTEAESARKRYNESKQKSRREASGQSQEHYARCLREVEISLLVLQAVNALKESEAA